jgi:hypothetical protein
MRVCTGNLDMHLDFDVATEIKNNCNLDTCVGPVGWEIIIDLSYPYLGLLYASYRQNFQLSKAFLALPFVC